MSINAATQPINVHRFGNPDAPPLVLVHGLTEDGTAWPDAVFRWAFHWDIHAVDLRGHGLSPRFTEEDVASSNQLWLEDLLTILRGLPRPAVLVGHSLGGLITLLAAVEAPELVRAVVLEDPAKTSDGPDPAFVREQQEFLSAFPDRTASEIERMRRETNWSESEILAWANSKALVDPLMIERALWLSEPEWESLFGRLTVPTLLVLPTDGGMGPDPDGYDNPLVERVLIADAGHCVRRDAPGQYYAVVEEFLARHRVTVQEPITSSNPDV
ncbi:alpha/beta hydrolase [Tessaracoccus sp. OS52]|uniref:alpha/beta fold hydrolase n=1 Tax=Tessaracoccus sp. OS52 TaxID=2886691 RepID=UPI001D0FB10B|nr:alpha/beta hydrolase [Tessaracoccus sp. OS52]MCC2592710.1 alpha/beta hydrolase [Tessaracoccus sp. OS52]